jgi:hypothetical protein
MDQPSKSHLAEVVECRHGLAPTRGEEVHILVERPGERPVERVVHAFDLPGRACGYRVFAWTENPLDGRRRICTKVHGPDWRSNEAVLKSKLARDE